VVRAIYAVAARAVKTRRGGGRFEGSAAPRRQIRNPSPGGEGLGVVPSRRLLAAFAGGAAGLGLWRGDGLGVGLGGRGAATGGVAADAAALAVGAGAGAGVAAGAAVLAAGAAAVLGLGLAGDSVAVGECQAGGEQRHDGADGEEFRGHEITSVVFVSV
jgi:hypothetical protein